VNCLLHTNFSSVHGGQTWLCGNQVWFKIRIAIQWGNTGSINTNEGQKQRGSIQDITSGSSTYGFLDVWPIHRKNCKSCAANRINEADKTQCNIPREPIERTRIVE
jgi:hypothetical protein